MKYKELVHKSIGELRELLNEAQYELRALGFKAGENQLKDVRKIRSVKKDIARISTAITFKNNA